MNTKDRKENQFVLIEFSEELQAFNFNLDGADKTAPSYMPIVWLPHLDAVRWTQEMKNLRADHRLTLEEVVERSMTPLVRLGTIKLECVRHMHKIRRDEVDGLSNEKRDEFFSQHTQEAKKFMLDDIFHTRLVEAGVYDNPYNKDIIVWAEVFVGVKDGIDIDKELAGEDYAIKGSDPVITMQDGTEPFNTDGLRWHPMSDPMLPWHTCLLVHEKSYCIVRRHDDGRMFEINNNIEIKEGDPYHLIKWIDLGDIAKR